MTAIFYLSPMMDAAAAEEPQMRQVVTALVTELEAGRPIPGWQEVTPGQLWVADQGVAVTRRDHRPILLTSELCATCKQMHMDVAHIYTVMTVNELYANREEAESAATARDPD